MLREVIGLGCITTAQLQLAMMSVLLRWTCQTPWLLVSFSFTWLLYLPTKQKLHSITEWVGGDLKDHLVPRPSCGLGAPHQIRLFRIPSNLEV